MRRFFLKFQLVFEALLLVVTLVLMSTVLHRYSYRWDLTREKVYSLPPATANVLKELKGKRLDLFLFFVQDDERRTGLEIFLKECQRYHADLHYSFYDPTRRPKLAQKFQVTEPSTIIVQSMGREERILEASEESFTNAFLRLLHPQSMSLCFTQGHGEVETASDLPTGYQAFRKILEGYNASVQEIVLSRDHVPDACQVVVVGGPRWEILPAELDDLKAAFQKGKGLLFLLDPMDPGAGQYLIAFAKEHGVSLGENVIVDKASRIVGGDFLMPLVSQYFMKHPVSRTMKEATFFPLVRSVQQAIDVPAGLEITPLAMTSADSWAETDLTALENGNSVFDIKTDVAGPLPVAVAVEQKQDDGRRKADGEKTKTPSSILHPLSSKEGRLIMIGDSDFLNNGYLSLSGNREFGLHAIQWLAKDDRFIEVRKPQFKFKALLLDVPKRSFLIFSALAILPAAFFIFGGLYLVIRSRTS